MAKAGLKFGDERTFKSARSIFSPNVFPTDLDPEEEKAEQKALTEKFQPLIDYLKKEAKDTVRDGMPSLPYCVFFVAHNDQSGYF